MENIDDGTGKKESRIKIIKEDSIGPYSWDSSDSDVNMGQGVNEWSQADLMSILNHGAYYHQTTGTCYNGENNATIECDFNSTGLLEESKNMIDTITWNTGSSGTLSYKSINTNMSYSLERSNNTGKICISGLSCNDSVERTTNWKGQVGLIYPSDYGYATSGGTTTTRENCLQSYIFQWNEEQYQECKENSWLLKKIRSIWTLTPNATEINAK